ncbi:PaaI family thioesterase [uncultured Jannaschia sp.]|uniref:PaaI family thioesterase n=1 Tax=uncultured Jannaschia sp. TaxID=293347 RepID=UPI00262061C2|nr:PaaI family thioesterase [uncultured Jannaschia sp.]
MAGIKMDVEALTAFLVRDFPQVCDQFVVERITEEGLILRLVVQDGHLRPGRTVSGPAIFALADVAVYLAILSRLGPVALAVTTNCSIDFMRKPAAGADLLCDVRLLKLGRVLAVADCLIGPAGSTAPVARAALTYSIPPNGPRGVPVTAPGT